MPELTERAASLYRFLDHHADVDGIVSPQSGVTIDTAPQRWAESEVEDPPTGVHVGGVLEATADDFAEVVSELVMKHRIEFVQGPGPLESLASQAMFKIVR